MGKRINPVGLRLNNTQSWVTELSSPLHLQKIDPNFKDSVSFVLKKHLKTFGIELVHVSIVNLDFICLAHVFVKSRVEETLQVLINKRMHGLFTTKFSVSYHNMLTWTASTPYQLRLLTGSLRIFRWYRVNEFFSSTMMTLQFSLAILNTSLLSEVIINLLRKHKRHWLILRFLKNLVGRDYKMNKHIRGLRIKISGKINGFSRKKRRILAWGIMPLQTIANNIDYSYRVAVTKFGVFGIKVWLYKI